MDAFSRMIHAVTVMELDSRIATKAMDIVQGFAFTVQNGSQEKKDQLRAILGSVGYRQVEEIAALLNESQAHMEEWIYG